MPIYEFQCQKCGKVAEVLCAIGTTSGGACPHCRSRAMRKRMSSFAMRSGGNGGGAASAAGGSKCSSCSSHNCGSCH